MKNATKNTLNILNKFKKLINEIENYYQENYHGNYSIRIRYVPRTR